MRLALCKWFALVSLMVFIGLTQFANPTYAAIGGSTAKPSNDEAADIITVISKKLEEPGLRGQHSKGHGVVWAEFTVEPSLPDDLKVGVFKEPGKTFSS